jgi:hypothetical protein
MWRQTVKCLHVKPSTYLAARGLTAPAVLNAAPRLGWAVPRSTIETSLRASRTGDAEAEARNTARMARENFMVMGMERLGREAG